MALNENEVIDLYQKNILLQYLKEAPQSSISDGKKDRKKTTYAKLYFIIIAAVIIMAAVFSSLPQSGELKTKYLVDDLRGDTVDTWKLWKIDDSSPLVVNIKSSDLVDQQKIRVVQEAIMSTRKIEIDDSVTHKGPAGGTSTFYLGWMGALQSYAGSTKYVIPSNFKVASNAEAGDIIIILSTSKDQDGYSGYTRSVVEGNEILKSYITIYDVDGLTDERLAAITRHEFGHALGLGHSTAPEDLMAPTVSMLVPYISECDVDAIVKLYDGHTLNEIVCEK